MECFIVILPVSEVASVLLHGKRNTDEVEVSVAHGLAPTAQGEQLGCLSCNFSRKPLFQKDIEEDI